MSSMTSGDLLRRLLGRLLVGGLFLRPGGVSGSGPLAVQVGHVFFGFFLGGAGVGIDGIFQTFFGTAAALTWKQ